jgi:amino acid transporter
LRVQTADERRLTNPTRGKRDQEERGYVKGADLSQFATLVIALALLGFGSASVLAHEVHDEPAFA